MWVKSGQPISGINIILSFLVYSGKDITLPSTCLIPARQPASIRQV